VFCLYENSRDNAILTYLLQASSHWMPLGLCAIRRTELCQPATIDEHRRCCQTPFDTASARAP
jgi:hypothetical protein